MSSWRGNEDEVVPGNFIELLYVNEEEHPGESELNDVEDVESGSRSPPEAPLLSPLTSPLHHESKREESKRDKYRERSRSPIRRNQPSESTSSGMVLQIFGEDGMPLDVDDSKSSKQEPKVLFMPDGQAFIVSPEKNDGGERRVTSPFLRERGGSGRRGGERGDWGIGLGQVWLKDEDIPAKFDDESGSRSSTPVAPPLSAPVPPLHHASKKEKRERDESPERSRSPIRINQPSESTSSGVVLRILYEDGMPLDADYNEIMKQERKSEIWLKNEAIPAKYDDESDSRSSTPDDPLSQLTSLNHASKKEEFEFERDESPDRSRSPIRFNQLSKYSPSGVGFRVFSGDGMPLDADNSESVKLEQNVFLMPDAHALFVSPEKDDGGEKRDTTPSLRESGRSRGRGDRGVRRGRGHYRSHRWEVGQPLKEVWLKDEDVPAELVSLNQESKMEKKRKGKRNRHEREYESEVEDDDNQLFDDPDISSRFEWSPMESFRGKEEVFLPKRTGATRKHHSAYDAFRSYWDDSIIGLIVSETNKYAQNIASSSFQSEWYRTNKDEILCLFAFWMMLGIIRMPTVTSCFSTDPLLKTEVFKRIFTRTRYGHLTRALHFIDSDAARTVDRLCRLRPIILHLNAKFQSNYILDKDICIDESLTLWKGRLDIKQYLRFKASKFGIKTFELCESTTGYLWSFIVYTGKQFSADLDQAPGELKSTAVVKNLIAPLLNKGYRLFMDNWYNSPLLARFLKRNGTDCVGTLRPCHRHVPFLVNKAPLERGEMIARHSGDVTVLSWQDKKRVTMISTCHGSSTALPSVPSRPLFRPAVFKPQMVLDYNKFMGGVDVKDQMLEPYLIERKRCSKWYMKLFKRLLNVSILNSRILLQSSTKKHHDHLAFRLRLADSILTNHLPHCPQSRRHAASNRSQHLEPGRLIPCAHWPTKLKGTAGSSEPTRTYRRLCVVCLREGRKTIRTTFCCETCKVPLCIMYCFKAYHTSS